MIKFVNSRDVGPLAIRQVLIQSDHFLFSSQVHVSDQKCGIYKEMAELRDVFTSDAMATKIHACYWEVRRTKKYFKF